MVLEGWPETTDPSTGPVTFWVSPEGRRRVVRVRMGELACTSDLQLERTASRKQGKYIWAIGPGTEKSRMGSGRDSSRGHSRSLIEGRCLWPTTGLPWGA
eukprot:1181498-Prorocentrum_minimum.AAC.2